MTFDEMKDKIARAEEIQRYTENRCEVLEKENAELKEKLEIEQNARGDWFGKAVTKDSQLTKAKDLLLRFIELKNKPCASGHSINMLLYENICAETEQFLNSEVEK